MSVDVAAENALTTGRTPYGDTNVSGHGDADVAGFARQISTNVGETVEFSVLGGAITIDIYRLGWYGGDGWRKVATIINTPATQPTPLTIANSNGATSCRNWSVTASWAIPLTACSGLYVALIRTPAGPTAPNGFWAPFIVRDDDAEADIIYKTSETTWGAAYNHYGTPANINGKDVYGSGTGVGNIMDRSLCVSYQRPIITRGSVVQTYFNACETPLIRFLERQGYRIKYITGVDLELDPSLLLNGKVFISSGHDEYWSETMRDAVEDWRDNDAGRSIFMSGNEVFWKTRFEHDATTGDVLMWCFKDTMPGPTGFARSAGAAFDPVTWTGTWKDQRWAGNRPEWLLTGTDFRMNGVVDYDVTIVSNPYGDHRVWGMTSLVDSTITITQVMGFEADNYRPTQPSESVKLLAAYTRNINGRYADDNGQNYSGNGDLVWGIVSQRYLGGGLSVGFGTCQWSWGLDGVHDRGVGDAAVSINAQQFMINLLGDLGAPPYTLMAGLNYIPPPLGVLDFYGLEPGAPVAEGLALWLSDVETSVNATLWIDGAEEPTTVEVWAG